jgi:peptidoglycan/xylan/chitin deacetylase (PgdA/CDA1 family)
MKRYLKIGISVCVFAILAPSRVIGRLFGLSGRRYLTVLMYHAVPPDQIANFERQVEQLKRWARVVPADWEDEASDQDPDGAPYLVAITFDDAFESALNNGLPVLEAQGLPCTVFVPSGHLGHPPSWKMNGDPGSAEQVATALHLSAVSSDLVTIGSHTVSHPYLTSLPKETVRQELVKSREVLSAISGEAVRLLAFPYGDHDATIIDLCVECGYKQVFTIEPLPVRLGRDVFVRGRAGVEPSDGRLEFFLKATGSYCWMPMVSSVKRKLLRTRHGRRTAHRSLPA